MDFASVKASVNSALETAATGIKTGFTACERGVRWLGRNFVWLVQTVVECVVEYSKAGWKHVSAFASATFKHATPYANQAWKFCTSPQGIVLGAIAATLLFANLGMSEFVQDNEKVKVYAFTCLSLISAVAVGVLAAQVPGLVPAIF